MTNNNRMITGICPALGTIDSPPSISRQFKMALSRFGKIHNDTSRYVAWFMSHILDKFDHMSEIHHKMHAKF